MEWRPGRRDPPRLQGDHERSATRAHARRRDSARPARPLRPPAWHGKRIEAVVPATRAPTPTAISPPCGDFRTRSSAPSERCRTRRSSRCSNANEPKGPHRYWKTEYLPGLTERLPRCLRRGRAEPAPSPMTSVRPVPPRWRAQRAIVRRRCRWEQRRPATSQASRERGRPTPDRDPHIEWVRRSWETIRPHPDRRQLRQLPAGRRRWHDGSRPPEGRPSSA